MEEDKEPKPEPGTHQLVEIKQEYAALKQRLVREKLTKLDEEEAAINDGSHPQVIKQMIGLKRQCDDSIAAADRYRQYQIQNINHLFASEKKAAEDHLAAQQAELKEKLIQDVRERRGFLEDDRNNVNMLEGGRSHPRPKRLRTGATVRRRQAGSAPSVKQNLAEGEVNEDFAVIQKNADMTTRLGGGEVRTNRGRLMYRSRMLQKNDSVIVESTNHGSGSATHTRIHGVITHITPTEVLVESPDSTRNHIPLAQLRSGRVVLHWIQR
eukprot:gnl/Trimastix_PCT/1815.p1 GENE.gnl/Trimastix_PCT/1815~~gnl/Trimastix_PCT/1815.p1  ORF type:complete len:275 (-),score=44.56 gnl/Trimastix_PCT/1815:108-911(-)